MRYTIILLSFLLCSSSLLAQKSNVISISSQESVDLPADIIQFNINLNAEADSPKEAYNLHQKREKALVQLLDQYDIKEEDIRFEPIGISKSGVNGRFSEEKITYQTRQAVALKLTDFDIYENIQIALIEEGFDNFNGSFLSSKAEEGKDNAIGKAIQAAKDKARLIAKEAGVKLGAIVGISYSHDQHRPVYARSADMMAFESNENQLMKYDQVVTVIANISIKFAIIQ